MINEGTQKGTADRDNRNFRPKKSLFPQKKAAGRPIKRAIKVEHAA